MTPAFYVRFSDKTEISLLTKTSPALCRFFEFLYIVFARNYYAKIQLSRNTICSSV